ncbi:Methionine aminopeptidase 1B, chloroplastic [Glycine soja]|uniref:Methionine aminopeptidase 1B, chloroplastic n=1 Tax=Glycine soja TaxID=3848 RepID=A0A0B2PNX9_GLYSO|nr:Methionine aminopeptidase 1B, chloroplastic [Glycine soja]
MALTASLAHNSFLKIPTAIHSEASPLCSSFMGSPPTLSRSSTLPGNQSLSRNQFVVFARKISGLEEAMNIRRDRELQVVTKFKKRPPLRCGRVSPRLPVPDHIPRPPYVGSDILPEIASEHQVHDYEGIAKMRAAGELAARVLNFAGTMVRHIELDLFFVREKVIGKHIQVVHVPVVDQRADILPKACSPSTFIVHRSKLRVVDKPLTNPS